MNNIPTVTRHLISINILFFLGQLSPQMESFLIGNLALFPVQSSLFQVWQVITYSFLHADFFHILLNMYALYLFGSKVERLWGTKRMLIYYVICVLGAAITQLLWQSFSAQQGILNVIRPTIGASGGVFGILLAFAFLFPNDELYIIPFPVPIKAKFLVIGYTALELFNGFMYTNSGVAHFAHLGGMLFGLIPLLLWTKRSNRYF